MEMRQGQRRFPIFSVVKVLIAAYLVTMVILLVLAGLLYKLELSEPVVDGGIIAAYVLSCFLGGFLMGKLQKTRKFMWGMIIGLLYYAVLFGVSFCMKQSSAQVTGDVFTSLVLCVASGMLGGRVA